MKPRLRRAPWTDEDWEIFSGFGVDTEEPHPLDVYILQDRCDADLMLEWSYARQIRIDHPGDPSGDFSAVLFFDDLKSTWGRTAQ